MSTGKLVRFHADGGQTCIDGHRYFAADQMPQMERFIAHLRAESGHSCERDAQARGGSTVTVEDADGPIPDEGDLYPAICGVQRIGDVPRELAGVAADVAIFSAATRAHLTAEAVRRVPPPRRGLWSRLRGAFGRD